MTTPDQFTQNLPRLTVDPLPITPPFEFNGLSSRVFPLRANLNTVQQLCNSYLNEVPPEVGQFRASMPYVYLAVLDYGQISDTMRAVGWFAQSEVFFCIPLEWYKLVNGEWVFHDWAVITPFIYVDDRISVPMGRSVYGFPKALAEFKSVRPIWTTDVVAAETVASIETDVMPELYDGDRLEAKKFLEIKRQPRLGSMPPNMATPFAPWNIASNFAGAMNEFYRDVAWVAQAPRIFPDGPGPASWMQMINQLLPALRMDGPGLVLNSLNLKQFRASAEPDIVCYQSLTNGRMQTTSFSGGGMLGGERSMLGDLSGGYSIELSEYPSLQISRKLGLEVSRTWRGDGVDVVELAPVLPFWLKVDVLYLQGQNLTWRCDDGIWRGPNGERLKKPTTPPRAEPRPYFNTSVNPVLDDIAGPFKFRNTTMRVLPLAADRTKLQQYLNRYVNDALADPKAQHEDIQPHDFRLNVWTDDDDEADTYVYLVVSTIGNVLSKSNNIGDWAHYDLAVMLPVQWQTRGTNGQWKSLGEGVLPAYNFVDDSAAAVSRREVQGIPTINGRFLKPAAQWMDGRPLSSDEPQRLLEVQTDVIPALGLGQEVQSRPIIEIFSGHVSGYTSADVASTQHDAEIGRRGHELIDEGLPVQHYTVKQFRDVVDPLKACFQSVQRFARRVLPLSKPDPILDHIMVRFHDYATISIAQTLGIGEPALDQESSGAGLVYEATAEDPFFLYCDVDEDLGEPLLTRVSTRQWTVMDAAEESTAEPETELDQNQSLASDPLRERLAKIGPRRAIRSFLAQSQQNP